MWVSLSPSCTIILAGCARCTTSFVGGTKVVVSAAVDFFLFRCRGRKAVFSTPSDVVPGLGGGRRVSKSRVAEVVFGWLWPKEGQSRGKILDGPLVAAQRRAHTIVYFGRRQMTCVYCGGDNDGMRLEIHSGTKSDTSGFVALKKLKKKLDQLA